jgi:hypothetical protein
VWSQPRSGNLFAGNSQRRYGRLQLRSGGHATAKVEPTVFIRQASSCDLHLVIFIS